jgi:hypothetical protein
MVAVLRRREPSACAIAAVIVSLAGASCGPTHSSSGAVALSSYSWRASWGPCPPGSDPCVEEFVVTAVGDVTYTQGSDVRTATLSPSDQARFASFLAGADLLAAIGDGRACPQVVDRTEVVTLFPADGGAPISRDVIGCTGAVFDEIGTWNDTFRSYFATSTDAGAGGQ